MPLKKGEKSSTDSNQGSRVEKKDNKKTIEDANPSTSTKRKPSEEEEDEEVVASSSASSTTSSTSLTYAKRPKVTKRFKLPDTRLIQDAHLVQWRKNREACLWCSWQAKLGLIVMDRRSPQQSQLWCTVCSVPLCANKTRNCFYEYHTTK